MPRTSPPQYLRPSDVIRISANGKGRTGRRGVVVEREVFDATTKVLYRGIVKNGYGETISESVEGFTSLSNRVLHPVEGVWEGELTPGAPGRTMEYSNRAYEAPKPRAKKVPQKGEPKMATRAKAKPKAAARKTTTAAPRATEAQLDKDAARVVKMRDQQGKSWGDIETATGIAASRLRALYNRGGGTPSATKAAGTRKGAAKPKPAAKGSTRASAKGKKRNPS